MKADGGEADGCGPQGMPMCEGGPVSNIAILNISGKKLKMCRSEKRLQIRIIKGQCQEGKK
jgi:hypothetical protein